jgi:hypothetical protein
MKKYFSFTIDSFRQYMLIKHILSSLGYKFSLGLTLKFEEHDYRNTIYLCMPILNSIFTPLSEKEMCWCNTPAWEADNCINLSHLELS